MLRLVFRWLSALLSMSLLGSAGGVAATTQSPMAFLLLAASIALMFLTVKLLEDEY